MKLSIETAYSLWIVGLFDQALEIKDALIKRKLRYQSFSRFCGLHIENGWLIN